MGRDVSTEIIIHHHSVDMKTFRFSILLIVSLVIQGCPRYLDVQLSNNAGSTVIIWIDKKNLTLENGRTVDLSSYIDATHKKNDLYVLDIEIREGDTKSKCEIPYHYVYGATEKVKGSPVDQLNLVLHSDMKIYVKDKGVNKQPKGFPLTCS